MKLWERESHGSITTDKVEIVTHEEWDDDKTGHMKELEPVSKDPLATQLLSTQHNLCSTPI